MIEDFPGVQQPVGIKRGFDAAHYINCFGTQLLLKGLLLSQAYPVFALLIVSLGF